MKESVGCGAKAEETVEMRGEVLSEVWKPGDAVFNAVFTCYLYLLNHASSLNSRIRLRSGGLAELESPIQTTRPSYGRFYINHA